MPIVPMLPKYVRRYKIVTQYTFENIGIIRTFAKNDGKSEAPSFVLIQIIYCWQAKKLMEPALKTLFGLLCTYTKLNFKLI